MKSSSTHDDWRVHLYNQERMLNSQDRIAVSLERLLDNQQEMAKLAVALHENLEQFTVMMNESSKATKGLVNGIIKVPVVIVLIGIASWTFYIGKIEEHTWLLIMAVAVFPYLGESITALAKLFGLGRGGVSGETK